MICPVLVLSALIPGWVVLARLLRCKVTFPFVIGEYRMGRYVDIR